MAAIRDSTATSRERSRCSHDRQAPGETEGYRDLTGAAPILPRPAKRAPTPGQYRDLTGAVPLLT